MPLFSSDRERRLWAWTLAVVVAIYSTLGLARTLAGPLLDRGLLDAVFVFRFLLVGGVHKAVLALAERRHPARASALGQGCAATDSHLC